MSKIPETVQLFITKYIDSLDDLEILLLLNDNPRKEWGASAVSSALMMDRQTAETRIRQLSAKGFAVARDLGGEKAYRIHFSSSEMSAAIAALRGFYPKYRVQIINMIFSKSLDSIRTFSDTFRIKRDEES